MGKGGGGGSQQAAPQQTSSNVYQTSIPDYARPYVQNMLNATQAQLFNVDPSGNITGFNQYQPYSGMTQEQYNAAAQAVAPFSPLQQQAQSSAANLQVPGQYGAATGVTGRGIMGSFGLGNQMQNLAASANPYDFQQQVGGYMSPYIQQALAPGLQQLAQQTGINTAGEQAAATSRGAFGGSREALANALAQQQGNMAAQSMIGQGYQNAFNAAQNQYNQQGAFQLQGLQGALGAYGQGMQGANQLANIGAGQLAAQQGILGTQNQLGAQQQAQAQNIINQGIQNYATAQQYPLMELGTMSNMLRGLPLQAATTQQYQAAPSPLTQTIGTAGSLAMLGSALGRKSGGLAKGIKGYLGGGVIDNTAQDLNDMPTDKLQEEMGITQSQVIKDKIKQILQSRAGAQYAGGGIIAFKEGSDNTVGEDAKQEMVKSVFSPENAGITSQILPSLTGAQQTSNDITATNPPPAQTSNGIIQAAPPVVLPPVAPPVNAPAQNAVTPLPANLSGDAAANIKALNAITDAARDKVLSGKSIMMPDENFEANFYKAKEMHVGPPTTEKDIARQEERRKREEQIYDQRDKMIKAAAFAKMATTPGSFLVASMTGVQQAIPQMIANMDKRNEAMGHIDDAIDAIYKADRAEKIGDFTAMNEAKQKAVDSYIKAVTPLEEARLRGTTDILGKDITGKYGIAEANIKAGAELGSARIHKEGAMNSEIIKLRGQAETGYRDTQNALKGAEAEFNKLVKDDARYGSYKGFLSKEENQKKDPVKWTNATKYVNSIEAPYNAKISELKSDLDYHKNNIRYYDKQLGNTSNETPKTETPKNEIPSAAIEALKKDPKLKDQFESKYGSGSASKYLK
jgi:hypothetical protein